MSGITNLKQTLSLLRVFSDDIKYGFASIRMTTDIDRNEVLATFQEDGRLAIIAPIDYLESKNIENEGPYAKLTIDVHTSLELVGLTAVLASKLAEHGISANVVAAFYHDHIFVKYEHRNKAIELLEDLKKS
jgi:hypothetical protein